ncbi:fibroblast growth factor receptor substrate 2 [Prorops nasuta]|uniref:fibroblast growth factor receptor substrate 2 n=1 Tax=Prorops nasuta TaxID=863751 RepID=UPI0034CFBACF
MGCVNSRTDINDLHSNIFQVMNVDDLGNLITPGRLEITDIDIILYQRGKPSIKWPLRCLRRYGYDAEIFSFESGRRCSTGPGIYAFKCRRAAHLFNLVQTNIQHVCNNSTDDTISRELPVVAHPASTVPRMTIPFEPNYLDPTPVRGNNRVNHRFASNQPNGIGRLGSIGSNSGPMSPQGTMGSPSPPPILPLQPPPNTSQPYLSPVYANDDILSAVTNVEVEHNNNKSLRRALQRSCTISSSTSNSGFIGIEQIPMHKSQEIVNHDKPCALPTASYINVDINSDISPLSPSHSISDVPSSKEDTNEVDGLSHAYMNISPGQENGDSSILRIRPPPLPPIQTDMEDGAKHCYANLEGNEIENLRKRFSAVSIHEKSPLPPSTPTGGSITREVNYAILDLDTKDIITGSLVDSTENTLPSPPESPNKLQKGYATIDFNKTAALSHSVNPNVVNDNEGSRKTRHNSTINDLNLPCRQSSSLSE